ncbi:unnamed protein product [Diplocarpon coronariae]
MANQYRWFYRSSAQSSGCRGDRLAGYVCVDIFSGGELFPWTFEKHLERLKGDLAGEGRDTTPTVGSELVYLSVDIDVLDPASAPVRGDLHLSALPVSRSYPRGTAPAPSHLSTADGTAVAGNHPRACGDVDSEVEVLPGVMPSGGVAEQDMIPMSRADTAL